MREFTRTEDALQAVSGGESLNMEDILGIYLDLCEDVKEKGRTLDELPIRDEEKLLRTLSRIGRIYINILRKRGAEIDAIDVRGRLERQKGEIAQRTEDLEAEEKKLDDGMTDINRNIRRQEERQKELVRRRSELEEKQRAYEDVASCCARLEEEILRTSEADLPAVQRRQQELQAQQEKLLRELSVQNDREKKLEQQVNASSERKRDREKELAEREAELEKLSREADEVENDIGIRAEEYNKAKDELERQRNLQETLKEEQSRLDADVVVTQNKIDQLRDHLTNSDSAKLQQELTRLQQESRENDEETARLQRETETEKAALEVRRKEKEAGLEDWKRKKGRLLDEIAEAEKQIRALEAETASYRKKKEELSNRVSETEGEQKRLKGWFDSLQLKEMNRRLKEAEEKASCYRGALKALFDETDKYGLFQIPEDMNYEEIHKKREELRSQMAEIEKQTDAFRKKFDKVSRYFSD